MPEQVGSGAALFDYDNDGRLDLYLIQNGGPDGKKNQLFHQEPDGTFKDVSRGSGLDVAGYGMGVAVGDVNNDGLPDVLVTEYGRIRLFLNNGNGTFSDVTRDSGLDNPGWATSAAFVDYDRDGWLDLVVVNYVNYSPGRWCGQSDSRQDYCGPATFEGTVSRLFRNRGLASAVNQPTTTTASAKPTTIGRAGAVTFEDVTLKSGLGAAPSAGLGVFCADFDGDGWPDIFISNDRRRNHLWMNRHDGTFREEALQRGIGFNSMGSANANMGIAIGDLQGDGLFDIFVTHLNTEDNTLWVQGPRGIFQDRTAAHGLASPRWRGTGFGTVLADFDLDGSPDLAVVNGRVGRDKIVPRPNGARNFDSYWDPYAERNQIFRNDGKGRMIDVSDENPAFCGAPAVGRGLAMGDLDTNGGIDLLVTSIGAPARLLHDIAPRRGRWALIRAVDRSLGGRDAYGAEVTVEAGGRRRVMQVNPASSFLCSNDPRLHFGLGPVNRIDRIIVRWPDGSAESFDEHGIDRLLTLRKGTGSVVKE